METTADASIGDIRITQLAKEGRWLLEWHEDDRISSKQFTYFEDVSRFVEGELLWWEAA